MRVYIFLATLLYGSVAGAASLTVDGNLPRDLSTGVVDLTVTVVNITSAERDAAGGSAFDKRLRVFLSDLSTSAALATRAEDAKEPVFAYLTEQQAPQEQQQTDRTWTITHRLQIRETQTGFLKEKFASGKMSIRVQYLLGDQVVAETPSNKVLSQLVYVINAAPLFDATTPIIGSHKRLTVFYNNPGAVAVLPAGQSQTPTGVNVFVVDIDAVAATVPLTAKKFAGASGSDAQALCTFTTPEAGSGACVDCGTTGDVFLDETAFENGKTAGFTMTRGSLAAGSVTVTGLENSKRYAVFLQYEPDGVQTTQCIAGQPSPNMTLTELNGEGEAEVVDFRCFIATSAYGSTEHENVKIFRRFRDRHLMSSTLGRKLVAAYYHWSPRLAGWLDENPNLKPFVRGALAVPATILGWTDLPLE